MIFLKFTKAHDNNIPVYIKRNSIVAFSVDLGNTNIYVNNDNQPWVVHESVDEILKILKKLGDCDTCIHNDKLPMPKECLNCDETQNYWEPIQ